VTTRVLLVDDLPATLQRIRGELSEPDQLEFVAEPLDGPASLESVREWQPDVVVVDTRVPRLSDEPVLARLRAVAPHATLVVFPAEETDSARESQRFGEIGGRWRYLCDLLVSVGHREGPANSVHLDATMASAGMARNFARETLATWCGVEDLRDDDAVDDVVLVVSELVSNAIRHVHRGCDLRLVLTDAVIRIECVDDGEGTPELLPRSTTRAFGRGLDLIDALTAAWGVEPMARQGKAVWAEVLRHRVPSTPVAH